MLETEKISLQPEIYDFTKEILKYVQEGKDLDPEVIKILKQYSPNDALNFRISENRDNVVEQIHKSLEIFDFEKAQETVKRGIARVQELYPEIEMNKFPVVFIFMPDNQGAKNLGGQGCFLNINEYRKLGTSIEETLQMIEDSVAHEATHLFLQQLELNPVYDKRSIKSFVHAMLWEEGLTTYMEKYHPPYHNEFIEEKDFWISIMKKWINSMELEEKRSILNDCINNKSFRSWLKYFNVSTNSIINERDTLDDNIRNVLIRLNGPIYHIGCYLWETQIKKGRSIQDIIKAGYTDTEDWISEEKIK